MLPATLKMGLMCGLGRMVTTFVEIEDPVIRFSSAMGAGLGLVMIAQMVLYKENTRKFLAGNVKSD